MDLVIAVILSVFLTSGIWLALSRRSTTRPHEDSPSDSSQEHLEAYQARIRVNTQWLARFSAFQQTLAQVTTREEMAQSLKHVLTQHDVKTGVFLAVGPTRDLALLDTLGQNIPALEITSNAFLMSYPEIESELSQELTQEIDSALREKASSQNRWWVLKELAPTLQDRLLKHFHLAGQGFVIPLSYRQANLGFVLVTGVELSGGPDVIRESGERYAVMGDMLTTWLRCTAPQILANQPDLAATDLPLDALASLDSLERAIVSLQEESESQEMLDALADYSHVSMAHIAERSLLTNQTCASLRKICQADFAMVLLPEGPQHFAVESISFDEWSWSHFAALQGQVTPHPLIRNEQILKNWPDAFTRLDYETGETRHAVKQKEVFVLANRLSDAGMESILVIPATLRQQCQALLVIGLKRPGGFPDSVLAVTTSVAAIVAMGLKTMQVTTERNAAKEALDRAWKAGSMLSHQMVEALSNITTMHGVLAAHSPKEVARYTEMIAHQLSIGKEQLFHLWLAAMTCDIGMIAIPTTLLRKEGGLTPEEWTVMQAHPQMSVNILKNASIFKEALPFIQHHHERWDGTGYPDRLKGAEIPLGARIIAVADAYVSMQTNRPYRKALSSADALEQLRSGADSQFDPDIVRALMRVIRAERNAEASVA